MAMVAGLVVAECSWWLGGERGVEAIAWNAGDGMSGGGRAKVTAW